MNTPNVIPWSYSSLNAFETCPKRYYLTRIAKLVKEPQSDAMHYSELFGEPPQLDMVQKLLLA